MTTLILCTGLSQTMLLVVLRELHQSAGGAIIIDTDDQVHSVLKAHAISSMRLRVSSHLGWAERDKNFRELCMPGQQLGMNFPDTELAVWKVIAMDRLNFWYLSDTAQRQYDYLMALNWDRAIVSADMNNPLGWTLAKHSGRPVVGVKVGSFRTREWYDMFHCGGVPFSELWVEHERDARFIAHNGFPNGKVVQI